MLSLLAALRQPPRDRVLQPVPTVVEREVRREFQLDVVGRTSQLQQRFYLISTEKLLKHPTLIAIRDNAAQSLVGKRG